MAFDGLEFSLVILITGIRNVCANWRKEAGAYISTETFIGS
jgi:hypothetical protein